MKKLILTLLPGIWLCTSFSTQAFCADGNPFPLVANGNAASIRVSKHDFPGVIRAAKDLQADIERVTDTKPELHIDTSPSGKEIVVIGTVGKSELIDRLIRNKKLTVDDVTGKWEAYVIQTIENPFPNVKRALVIAGSDKRGTIFGIYEISKQIGVSPWHWWADVPVKKQKNVSVSSERQTSSPHVKYRGIFINDEQPALGGWVNENYGGFNSKFYVKVFELILRLKGNFLWPAMWGQSFYTEDTLNPKLADEYGIVISTSHHEPMMRAHVEWERAKAGKWNYATNTSALQNFWREGISRMGDYESVVTLAMRGDGDEPMSEESNIELLQQIVSDQRKILEEVTKKKITEVPQVWALYKEVQDYYDKGMRVPDDVTLLLCDDNWGNIRKLPGKTESKRAGG
ncbi:MAG TPA: glycosyl hydrolase 115 family protein, partial [Cyclobacteriaceae bacterium]|nr:glycosyl hydrolase 115 family protein [Cyclobacteriaceae bacterium]